MGVSGETHNLARDGSGSVGASGKLVAARRTPGAAQPRAYRWRRVSRGQALVEFALVAPIFFLLIFGVIEFSLINASIGAYNFAAKDAARLGSIRGPTDANIDQEIVALVNGHVSAVPAATTLEIDIFQADSAGAPTGKLDAYTPAGAAIGTPSWTYNQRIDNQADADYLGVRVIYEYTYVTALLSSGAPDIRLTTTAVLRIEPQEFSGRLTPTEFSVGQELPAPMEVATFAAPDLVAPKNMRVVFTSKQGAWR